jgi:hypothetical protein
MDNHSSKSSHKYQLQATQKQVDDVVIIMKDNLNKVLERDQKLGDLETNTEELQIRAQRFQRVSHKLKNKMFWKNMRFMIILAVIILVVILIISLIVIKSR